ncbi:hypothetical protein HanPI659440_Chr09g0324601 [Helianthus annuus]|nr:hypothetical protein HanPI659440_Chr09g0324601 [Helianthus annuus]
MFNNEAVKELSKKIAELEKEKAKAEAEHDALKMQIEELMKTSDQIRIVLIDQEEKINKMEDDVEDNTKLFNIMQKEKSEMNKKLAKMNYINQTLNQLISELSEASANEMKAMKLKMEAMKADKVMKDNQLNMLYVVMESHLKIDVHAAFNEIEVKKAEDRRIERERRLAEEATGKKKSVTEETQEAGGSLSQIDVEMTEAGADPQGFVLVGESSGSLDLNDILRQVNDLQKKRKAREVLMLEWKKEEVEEETQNFILIGKASSVPYSIKEIVRKIKIKERRRKAKIARGEIVDDDSDIELFGDEEEDDDGNDDDDKSDKKDDKDDKKNDDDDQGASGLLIENLNVQQRIEEFLNDEINEQEDDLHQEASTSRKQHADQVFLTNPTVIYLHAQHEGELEVLRSREEMLEELGLENGKFKFDIEDEIPPSPEREFEFRYAQEADHYNDVIVEDASDSSDEETDFHYSRIDETFPSLAEMFKDRNGDEITRKIVEKVSTEGVPNTIPRENLAEERKKWFKVMPKERKSLRALQFFTHNKNISWGDILSWGYLEDLKVYAIRREQGVRYFEYLSDIRTLPWWDVDELVKIKNIKQFYHGLEVKQHDQRLWNYVKLQAKAGYPDWKPQRPKQIVTMLENGEKDINMDIKPPRCLKNMPLRAMEQDFHDLFVGWLYNETTAEAVISLFDKSKGESRRICILDPMWLVNCSKKDTDCLFYNKIVYERRDREQAMQY